jgi:hypothetical protein
MAQAVSRCPIAAKVPEARVLGRVRPHGICNGQSGTRTGYSQSSLVSSVNTIPPWFPFFIHQLGDEQ